MLIKYSAVETKCAISFSDTDINTYKLLHKNVTVAITDSASNWLYTHYNLRSASFLFFYSKCQIRIFADLELTMTYEALQSLLIWTCKSTHLITTLV